MEFEKYIVSLLGKKKAKELKMAIKYKRTIIISGPQGPTGKTTLARILEKRGCTVIENVYGHDCEIILDKQIAEPEREFYCKIV